MLPISFEFFPPRTENAKEKLIKTAKELATLNPAFFSVTFGAGGSTIEGTQETVSTLQRQTQIDCIPHISCMGANKPLVKQLIEQYQTTGVKRLVVLRGDRPFGMGVEKKPLNYANDLVQFIRELTHDYFHIYVAAYPEYHPESSSVANDIYYLKQKVLSGADGIITQYFYNVEAYYHLIDQCEKNQITVPVIPGIMPMTNYTQLARFSDRCGTEIPRWLRLKLSDYQDDLPSLRAFGHDVVLRLCDQLQQSGVPGFHFYTLNQAEPSIKLCEALRTMTSS